MSVTVQNSAMLYCGQNGSNKEYLVEIYRDSSSAVTSLQMRGRYGPAGNLRSCKEYGQYTIAKARTLIKSKMDKSYDIVRVDNKPFTSGLLDDCMKILDPGGKWDSTSTAQPIQLVKAREVNVTFDEGQCAPVW
jgi:hypothetical protein